MRSNTNCCYKCEKRFLGCHGTCGAYQETVRERQTIRKKKRLESVWIDHHRESVSRCY